MSSDEILSKEDVNDVSSIPSTPTATLEYSRTVSQDLRYLDEALTHAIDQLTIFNSETMSDLSLKYELMRNNESRVISFFARQLMVLQAQKQNSGFHSEYAKLDRFLSVINFNKKSIEYITQRITFDDLLNHNVTEHEQILYDAETTETQRTDFVNALNALKSCIDYFSTGGTNDKGRFYWHKEIPTTTSVRPHRLSDTALPTQPIIETVRSTSVSSSISTEFGTTANNNHNHTTVPSSPHARRNNLSHTPPPSRLNHLSVNGKGKCEHPSKKSSVDPTVFNNNTNTSRNIDLQLPNDDSSSRRSSYGSDSESRLASEFEHTLENEIVTHSDQLAMRKLAITSYKNPSYSNTSINKRQYTIDNNVQHNEENKSPSSPAKKFSWNKSMSKDGSATPKSPTIRSPTMSGSPFGSAQNSDAENETRIPDAPLYNTSLSFLGHRMAHKIQHKRQVFRGKACLHCKYKCHRECVINAPPNCGFSENKLRRAIDNTDIQHALANSSPMTRKYPFPPWDNTSPTPSTPISVPGSPAPHSGYHFNPSICISESIYSTQNDPDSWVVIDTTNKSVPEIPESQSDSDTNSTIQTETGTNLIDSTTTISSKLVRQASQSEPLAHPKREDLVKSKLFDINSFDDDEADPEKRSANLATSLQDWVIVFNNIKIIEELPRSSGRLMKAHWHGEIAVRMIKPNSKTSQVDFLNQFKNQVFRLRKVRHEHLNLYTGVCIESPNLAIVSNWIRGPNLYEMIHLRNDNISLNAAVQYAAQIAQAMSYLHEKSINHMSLRTTNIFVQNTRIILTDYGLVPLSKCYQITDQPAIIAPRGWLSYLAPEIIRKLDPRDEQPMLQYTPQTDVYAFGTVWYELLFREFPYAKQPPEYIIWRAGNSLKQPLSSVHISKYAKDIINQCWSFVPDDRPDFDMLCKSLSKMPNKRTLVRSPSTPLQYNTRPHIEAQF
ncbi:unnamed protein product [Adineta steineri]|uniref:Protein kinase domain-containing protein n=1 Tax=Adineta steineri TaxID=433720 RepID=A0A813ZZE0_9BILA|nr:unnamed protein product [Adineta steineri]CAF0907378.1 unnamed protein product [Adineta steineri]